MNLLQKLISLLILILLVEIGLVGSLWWMLDQARAQTEQEVHLTSISNQRYRLLSELNLALTCLWKYEWTGSSELLLRYSKARSSAEKSYRKLNSVLLRDGSSAPAAVEIDRSFEKFIHFLDDFNAYQRSRRQDIPYKIGLIQNLDLIADSLVSNVESLNRQRGQEAAKLRANRRRLESLIRSVVVVALVLNMVIPFALAILIYNGHLRKLRTIVANCLRFSQNQELLPALQGDDELGVLDLSFHEMAKQIQKAMSRERAILDNMLAGLVILDADGRVLSANNRLAQMLDTGESSLIGGYLPDMVEVTTCTERLPFDRFRALSEDNVVRLTTSASADRITMEFSMTRFESSEGECWLGSFLDVTEIMESERLRQEFVAMVGHDLKSPLMSVQTTLGMLEQQKITSHSESGLALIREAETESRRILRFVDDLLELSKLENVGFAINRSDVGLWQLINRSLVVLGPVAESKNVQLVFDQSDGQVWADADRILQVVINLVSNAVKFSNPDGVVDISVSQSNAFTEVTVRDRGIGIDLADQPHVFHPFSRGGLQDHGEGSGLGLAICKAIVLQHQGEIGFQSTPGEGSTFWFRLPISDQESAV